MTKVPRNLRFSPIIRHGGGSMVPYSTRDECGKTQQASFRYPGLVSRFTQNEEK